MSNSLMAGHRSTRDAAAIKVQVAKRLNDPPRHTNASTKPCDPAQQANRLVKFEDEDLGMLQFESDDKEVNGRIQYCA